MDIEMANNIPLPEIMEKIGHIPTKRDRENLWYFSPFSRQKAETFRVNTDKNTWVDFGEKNSGTAIEFVCLYLKQQEEDYTLADALRWLTTMQKNSIVSLLDDNQHYSANLSMRSASNLQNPPFIRYLESRGIPFALAKKYLREIVVVNEKSKRTFSAFGMQNLSDGFELRNKSFKGSIYPKGISLVRGKTTLPLEVNVFNSFMDFLSALVYLKISQFEGDAIILNSTACLPLAEPYIKNYSYRIITSWLDNNTSGEDATANLKAFADKEDAFIFRTMNDLYKPYKDVNEWHMQMMARQKASEGFAGLYQSYPIHGGE